MTALTFALGCRNNDGQEKKHLSPWYAQDLHHVLYCHPIATENKMPMLLREILAEHSIKNINWVELYYISKLSIFSNIIGEVMSSMYEAFFLYTVSKLI